MMDPFQRLTQELWEKVLQHLEDPEDKLKLIGVNAALEKAFQNKKVEWGLAAALPLLFEWGNKEILFSKTKEGDDLRLRKLFLDCRLVSTSCFHATEKYVELHGHYSRLIPPHPKLSSRGSVCRLFDKMKNHPREGRCPIISRRLQLEYSAAPENLSIMPTTEQITGLLERIGQNLMTFELRAMGFADVNTCRVFLQALLGLLPNLKKLQFWTFQNAEMDPDLEEEQLEPLILPNFSRLTILYLLSDDPDFVRSSWFRPCYPQLENLYINLLYWDEEYNNSATGSFPNLRKLLLFVYFEIMEDEVIRELYQLFKNLEAPKLKYFSLFMATNHPFEVSEKNMHFVENVGLTFLSKRYPDIKWKGKSGETTSFSQAARSLNVQLYDSSCVTPLPITPPPGPPPPPQQQQNGRMCLIV